MRDGESERSAGPVHAPVQSAGCAPGLAGRAEPSSPLARLNRAGKAHSSLRLFLSITFLPRGTDS